MVVFSNFIKNSSSLIIYHKQNAVAMRPLLHPQNKMNLSHLRQSQGVNSPALSATAQKHQYNQTAGRS